MSTFAFSDDKSKVDISSLVSGGVTVDMVYPVGSIFISTVSADPSTYMPNTTWTPIQGRFLVAAGDNGASGDAALNLAAGSTGGESSHRLSASESGVGNHSHNATMPFHKHGIPSHRHSFGSGEMQFMGSKGTFVRKYGVKNGTGTTLGTGLFQKGTTSTDTEPVNTRYYSGGNVSMKTDEASETAYTDDYIWNANATQHMGKQTGMPMTTQNAAATSVSSHNNLPPYLAVYMWRRVS